MRNCDSCGDPYQAIRETSRFCSARCRVRNANAKRAGKQQVAPKKPQVVVVSESGAPALVEVTRKKLEEADRLDTVAGQAALRIAQSMSGRETGGGIAALSKELSRVMDEALENAVSVVVNGY